MQTNGAEDARAGGRGGGNWVLVQSEGIERFASGLNAPAHILIVLVRGDVMLGHEYSDSGVAAA